MCICYPASSLLSRIAALRLAMVVPSFTGRMRSLQRLCELHRDGFWSGHTLFARASCSPHCPLQPSWVDVLGCLY